MTSKTIKDIENAKICKRDEQGRIVFASDEGWAAGLSYNNSFDEAYKLAIEGMIEFGIKPNQMLTLMINQVWQTIAGKYVSLMVGFDYKSF